MFIIQWIERNTPREQWNDLYRIIRKAGDRGSVHDESELAERVKIAERIAKYTEDGEVCTVESGRDCDMSEYCYSTLHTDMTVMKFVRKERDMYEWADGPCYLGLCRPSERPEGYSRDLALEAYEDGHPHIVSSVRFDEEGMY